MDSHSKIISFVKNQFSDRFRVLDNTGTDKTLVGGQFPDIIFMRQEPPPNTDILFVMKIETGDDLYESVPVWQGLCSTPSVLYILVPTNKLDEAKKIADFASVVARFAPYEIRDGEVTKIDYE